MNQASAKRGLILITSAKLWFMVAGYFIQFALPRVLGSAERFGVWVIVLSFLSPLNNVVITATIQTVARFCSAPGMSIRRLFRTAFRLQLILGVALGILFVVFSSTMATFERDLSLTPYLRIAAGVVVAYSLYAVFVGIANGLRAFQTQALLDMTFSTLRAGFVVGGAWLIGGVGGSIGGFVAAALVILTLAALVVPRGGDAGDSVAPKDLMRFFAAVSVYLLITNLVMFVDGLLLKRLVAGWAQAHGQAVEEAARLANTQEGLWGAVQTIARIPYQLLLAVTFVIFPLVSSAAAEGKTAQTTRMIETTLRYSAVGATILCLVLAARPAATLHLLYPRGYEGGAMALALLAAGYGCFTLAGIAGTVLNSAGYTRASWWVAGSMLAATCAGDWIGIELALQRAGDVLLGAAIGTTAAMALGLVVSGWLLHRYFSVKVPWRTVLRLTAVSGLIILVGRIWPGAGFLGGKVGTLVWFSVAGVLALVGMVLLGEVSVAEVLASRRK